MVPNNNNLPDDYLLRFWAKTTHDIDKLHNAYHPLICHLIDVGCVTQLMWNEVLPNATTRRINNAFGFEAEKEAKLAATGNLISFIAGLHDIGKCSPPFTLRGKNESPNGQTFRLLELYRQTGLDANGVLPAREAPHGYVTAVELPAILTTKFGFPRRLAQSISTMIGGHHGIFPSSLKLQRLRNETAVGNEAWSIARKDLVSTVAELFQVRSNCSQAAHKPLDNSTMMILAGLVSVADWIGSNAEYFECAIADSTRPELELIQGSLDMYFDHSKAQARKALENLGWLGWVQPEKAKSFEELFPSITARRDLQDAAVEIGTQFTQPGIVVVEAPMGEGKTEAAMFMADAWNAVLEQRGIYFALPTQATSNQMFGRVLQFLENRFEEGVVPVQLLHGKTMFSDEAKKLKRNFREQLELKLRYGHAEIKSELETLEHAEEPQVERIYDDAKYAHDECTPAIVAAEWFTYKKRGLLAPFGVGTIDQALLSVLQTKHIFVRLFGLSHKTIIIDEVHAYDAYMSTLLERMLEWLAALGSPVVLLSATLPKKRRNALVRAYRRGLGVESNNPDAANDIYPRITWTNGSKVTVRNLETSNQNKKSLRIEQTGSDFVNDLKKSLVSGGCAAIICNTVDRAQELYRELEGDEFFKGSASDGGPKLDLLHARFRYRDRQTREQRCLMRFGKPGPAGEESKRPNLAVLISTQIIEQSLDLDFDLMITELAPADLILQRAGRLHRHLRPLRPTGLENPTLRIIHPELLASGFPEFGATGFVYDRHILLRSWLKLKDISTIRIPDEIEELVESVYDDSRECFDVRFADLWRETKQKMESSLADKRQKAMSCYLTYTDDDQIFDAFNLDLDEDNPEKHRALQALTRDNDVPTVSVVILTESEARKVDSATKPNKALSEFLLLREAKISKYGLAPKLGCDPTLRPVGWRQSPLLRNHRLIVLDSGNEFKTDKFTIVLDDSRGVVIRKREKNQNEKV
jgi:CRISPR-associated endonuclease/helicase Cas3